MTRFTLPATTHIGRVRLKIADLDRSLRFYGDHLGLQVVRRENDSAHLAARADGPILIILTAIPNAQPKPRRSTGLYHVAIRLPDRPALARVFKRLVDLGWPFQGFSDHKVSEAIYLADPDGNGLELYRDKPRSAWPWKDKQIAMSTDPLDVEALLNEAEADPQPWRGIHPDTDIGHVHLHVRDLLEAEAFYRDVLGLDVMQRTYPGALFFAAGGYHHHVGVNTWIGRHAAAPPSNAVGMEYFTLMVPDRSAIETIARRGREQNRLLSEDEDGVWLEDGAGNVVCVAERE
ncbi:MAG: VOC family protein [Chloroflexi bacterium]|nr:VOC family protein [Chloroflexota bacterium]